MSNTSTALPARPTAAKPAPARAAARGHSLPNDEWYTPSAFARALEELTELEFILDVASAAHAAKAPWFFDAKANGLSQDWAASVRQLAPENPRRACFMNPPYSSPGTWAAKAAETATSGVPVVGLLRASVGTKWFHAHCWSAADVYLVRGRLAFTRPNVPAAKANHDSIVVVWRPDVTCLPKFGRIDETGSLIAD